MRETFFFCVKQSSVYLGWYRILYSTYAKTSLAQTSIFHSGGVVIIVVAHDDDLFEKVLWYVASWTVILPYAHFIYEPLKAR